MKKRMNLRIVVLVLALGALAAGCRYDSGTTNTSGTTGATTAPVRRAAGPLPDNAFKAQLTLVNPPAKLRAGQKETIQVKVKNASDALWYARGGEVNTNPDNRFYLAAGNRWLKADGQTLVTNMDGRYGLPVDLKPGEETEVPLQVTAPKDPGDYVLDVDLIQEQVAWFIDKGSPTAKTKVVVVK
jgi:hypothetical protein